MPVRGDDPVITTLLMDVGASADCPLDECRSGRCALRDAGTIPDACNPGDEKNGALCYPACQGGFYGVGPVCWQSCPAGYADHGATCFQHIFSWFFKASYGRGAGYAPGNCPGGRQNDAGLCYPYCAAGYHGVGPVCCPLRQASRTASPLALRRSVTVKTPM